MIQEKDVLGYIDPRRKFARANDTRSQMLHQAAMGLADFRQNTPRFKTKDLVNLLLAHGARSWRSSMPATVVRLRVYAPDGKAAIMLNME